MSLRVGIGHDTHRIGPGGPLRLGGLDIPWDRQLIGHSDADVLLHAITDAILGAAALGDIGELFPDTDPANKNRDSADMLARAYGAAVMAGWRVVNVDCIVLAQRPKLSEYKGAIRASIANPRHPRRRRRRESQNGRRRRCRRPRGSDPGAVCGAARKTVGAAPAAQSEDD